MRDRAYLWMIRLSHVGGIAAFISALHWIAHLLTGTPHGGW